MLLATRRAFRAAVGFTGIAALVLFASPVSAQVASSLLNEGDPFPAAGAGHTVSSLSNTAVNHAGGYALSVNSSDGTTTLSHVWGNASGGPGAIFRTEGTFGPLTQTSFESFYGISNAGDVCYSASGTGGPVGGFDSVWKNDTPIAVEGDPYPHAPDTWWRFGSRPGCSADGMPFFVGGLTDVQGGSTQNRGLFFGPTGAPVVVGGDLLPNLPFPLSTANSVSFDYRYSELASDWIAEVQMTGPSTSADGAMVVSGQGLVLGGTLVQEGNLIPASVGGDGSENWDNFDYTGITEAGDWFFTGDTDGNTATDEIVVKNGIILHREGDILDGQDLSGSIEGAYMNADGDLAFIWDIQGGSREALYVNNDLVLTEGDPVDLDGDGIVDGGTSLANFTGISTLTLSDRDLTGRVYAYFTADIDTAGTTSSTDDIEGFFCLPVDLAPVPVDFSWVRASVPLRSQSVIVEWATALELDHDGYNVYRSLSLDGGWARLNDGLVRGQSPYRFADEDVRRGTTYFYRIGAVSLAGDEQLSDPVRLTTPLWGVRTALEPNLPNPFVRRTQISFNLVRDTHARLDVFDVAGRRVATLVDGALPAGEHDVWWDGSTELGARAAGGVYFYRLEADGLTMTRKMVRLQRD